jgi:hypothetical protein
MKRAIAGACLLLVLGVAAWWLRSHRQLAVSGSQGAAVGTAVSGSSEPSVLVQDRTTGALSAAFDSGTLPAPLSIPSDIDPGRQAERLAAAVARRDGQSTAALVAAVSAAGYDIRGDDGNISVAAPAARRQGLVLDAWLVAGLAKLYGEGYGVGLDALGSALAKGDAVMAGSDFGGDVLTGVRAAADSPHDGLRFWAAFINELGRRHTEPIDLLDADTTPEIRLDPIQVAFILSRVAGDIAAAAHANQSGTTGRLGSGDAAHLVLASYLTAPAAAAPCSMNDIASDVVDYGALSATTAFGQIANRVGGAAESYARKAGKASVVLTLLKFFASYAALDVQLDMRGQPLVRTQNRTAGEKKTVTATAKINTGKWQYLNCTRIMLNAAGLDFSLPADGPVANAKMTFTLVEGDGLSGFAAAVHTAEHITDILSGNGDGSEYSALIYLESPNRGPAMDGIEYTNGDGQASIVVVGMPQFRDLSHEALQKVDRRGGAAVRVQLKPTKLTTVAQAAGTFGDMLGPIVAALTGDVAGMTAGIATETVYRSQWYTSNPYVFRVQDWLQCDQGWTGSVVVERTLDEDKDLSGPYKDADGHVHGTQHGSAIHTLNDVTTYTFTADDSGGSQVKAQRSYFELEARVLDYTTDTACANEGAGGTGTFHVAESTSKVGQGSDRAAAVFQLDLENSDNPPPSPMAHVAAVADETAPMTLTSHYEKVSRGHRQCVNSGAHEDPPENVHTDSKDQQMVAMTPFEAPQNPSHPDELHGSKTAVDTDGVKTTITWNLSRCHKGQ